VELPGLLGATKQESFAFRPGRFNEENGAPVELIETALTEEEVLENVKSY